LQVVAMAFSTKGWRRIVVAGQTFFWRRGTHGGWPLFQVRPALESHRLLIATYNHCDNSTPAFSGSATPRTVQVAIEAALAVGWAAEHPQVQVVAFSNPLRCVSVQPSWLTTDVRALAEGIWQDDAFDRLPVLADALQEAGCDNEDVLNHCRHPGEHHRRCWVVQLITARK
jgi:hypothetical protein